MYPVNLDIKDKLCVVIGGGNVAARKISSLLSSGAFVRVVSPDICDGIRKYLENKKIEWIQGDYELGALASAQLVFAATNNTKVQENIVADSQRLGLMVNIADNPGISSFHVPASIHRGDLSISVSTNGASPALAAMIKNDIAKQYGPEYEQYVKLLGLIRPQVTKADDLYDDHKKVFKKLLQMNIMGLIADKNWEELNSNLQKILPNSVDLKSIIKIMME